MKVTPSCLTLCDPMDYTVHGILQARILEWVVSPSPGDLLNPGIKPRSPTLKADSLPAEPQWKPIFMKLILMLAIALSLPFKTQQNGREIGGFFFFFSLSLFLILSANIF